MKETNVKNRTCYHFEDIVGGYDFHNILLLEKSYEYILIYDTLYKTFMCAKPLRVRFDKVEGIFFFLSGRWTY